MSRSKCTCQQEQWHPSYLKNIHVLFRFVVLHLGDGIRVSQGYFSRTGKSYDRSSANEAALTAWWRHQVETFPALLALCAGNSPVPVNSPHKDQWRGALMFSLICAWINDWVNNREAGDLRRHRGHYDLNVMEIYIDSVMPKRRNSLAIALGLCLFFH